MPTPPAGFPNVSASDVALPVYARLQAELGRFLATDPAGDLEDPVEWYRLPSPAALRTAVTPSVAVIVDGLAGPPTYSSRTGYAAVWDVTAAVWIRGVDYDETRSRVERYVALMRACLLSSTDGIARRWVWADEHYDQVPDASAARTLAGGYLALTVEVQSASVPNLIGVAATPAGEFTKSATSIRPARGSIADLMPNP